MPAEPAVKFHKTENVQRAALLEECKMDVRMHKPNKTKEEDMHAYLASGGYASSNNYLTLATKRQEIEDGLLAGSRKISRSSIKKKAHTNISPGS